MGVRIDPIVLQFTSCYLIRAEGAILIDGGPPGQGERFKKALESLSVKPQDIRLIVFTHGHWDHIGSAADIKASTGAKIALHRREKDWLEKSLTPLPPGVTTWGRIMFKLMAAMPSAPIPTAQVDWVLGNDELSLAEYGIPGRIIYTPGHSSGSVSVLLDTGDAFVGDLAMNGLPLRLNPGLPIFAEDMQQVRASWALLLSKGARRIYPAHGKPFPADVIRKALVVPGSRSDK
jgi:glyoxylase-like metal-dependent hydrolase (beta-lactamase superfamily II)